MLTVKASGRNGPLQGEPSGNTERQGQRQRGGAALENFPFLVEALGKQGHDFGWGLGNKDQ